MNARNAATKTSSSNGRHQFPAEASQYFPEVPKDKMEELRIESEKLLAEDDWDLVDGLDFPYAKSA
jgi:hypothetical protein